MDEKEMNGAEIAEATDNVTDTAADAVQPVDVVGAPQGKSGLWKKMILAVALLIAALVAVKAVSSMDFITDDNDYVDGGDGEGEGNKTEMPRDLYDPDWETDIFTLDRYLEKKPEHLTYGKYNGAMVEYSEVLVNRNKCFSAGGSALALMYDYFDGVRRGDHAAVNAFYADGYFDGEEKKPYEAFPMQKIYDLKVFKYEYEDKRFENSTATPTYYLVTYKIMENDGLYRYELDSDMEIPQLFGVLTYPDGGSRIYMQMDLPDFVIID